MTAAPPVISRRSLVLGAGVAALAAPFLRPTRALAQAAAPPPKRLVLIWTPNGSTMSNYWSPDMSRLARIVQPFVDPMYGAEALRAKMLVLRGIDSRAAMKNPVPVDHEPDQSSTFTGFQTISPTGAYHHVAAGPSLDQALARELGGGTRFPAVNLGVAGQYAGITTSWLGRAAPATIERDPAAAFRRLFSGITATPATMDRLRAERQSVLGAVRAQLAAVRCQVSAADRARFDEHLASLHALEASLRPGPVVPACAPPALGGAVSDAENDAYPTIMRQMLDLTGMAVACRLSRFFTIECRGGNHRYTWSGAMNVGYHDIAHANGGFPSAQVPEQTTLIETWYARQIAAFCKRLDAIPEGEGTTVLDNTVVVWAHEQANASSHSRRDFPWLIVGNAGGYLRTGRAIQFSGEPHNRLLTTLGRAMGSSMTSFGDPDFGGALDALRA